MDFMKKFKKIQIDTIDDIICDICGNSCYIGLQDIKDFYGVSIKYHAGYFSKYFEDNTNIELDLCEKCLWNLFNSRKQKE